MLEIKTGKSTDFAPKWARLQREIIGLYNKSLDLILKKYLRGNGEFKWPPAVDQDGGYGAVDDAYESFFSWPLFYLVGGDRRFFDKALEEFETINRQFSVLPYGANGRMVVEDDYYSYCDWMHQGEGNQLFYLMNLAQPENVRLKELSVKFAGLFLEGEQGNFDEKNRVFPSPFHGSAGPLSDDEGETIPFGYADYMDHYGLPYYDVPGVITLDDLRDPEKALRMGETVKNREWKSDSVVNLMCTSLMMNAYMQTGDEKYKDWVLSYTDAWRERTKENGGLVPDNAGPSGRVGEMTGGRWYGGHYGWTFPHGYWFISEAVSAACENEVLLTGDVSRAQWMTELGEYMLEKAMETDGMRLIPHKCTDPGAVIEYLPTDSFVSGSDIFAPVYEEAAFNVDMSYREPASTTVPVCVLSQNREFTRKYQTDDGWYEFMPMRPQPMTHAYNLTRAGRDLNVLERCRVPAYGTIGRFGVSFFKNIAGQEYSWLSYLNGDWPDWPEKILEFTMALFFARIKKMNEDTQDPMTYDDSYIQVRNPFCMEGLVLTTLGGPMPLYNGGLLNVSLLYHDPDEKRVGLPKDVAALIEKNEKDTLRVMLVNLHPCEERRIILQAGAFGEHTFTVVDYEGENGEKNRAAANSQHLMCTLKPASQAHLEIGIDRFSHRPKYYSSEEL